MEIHAGPEMGWMKLKNPLVGECEHDHLVR